MRVVTFNIHGWRTQNGEQNLDRVICTLDAVRADIIGLNEVFHPCSAEPDQRSALEHLAERLGMNYVFGPCLRWPATEDLPERSFGNALLSRWPIIASATHHLTPIPGKEQRGLLESRISLPDPPSLTVYVTHLDHTDEQARLTQFRAVHSWTVRDRDRPHILMGDFNAVHPWDFAERRDALRKLVEHHPKAGYLLEEGQGPQLIPQVEKAGYVDALRACGRPGQGTFIPAAVPLRIDYVWVTPSLAPAVRHAEVFHEKTGTEASDHRPVVVELDG